MPEINVKNMGEAEPELCLSSGGGGLGWKIEAGSAGTPLGRGAGLGW
jgi:hypothetical protein